MHDDVAEDELAPIEVELTDELDLHTFAPREVAELVADYLEECRGRGFQRVRIIHGKGTGTLRRIVHGVLERHEAVARYALADESAGGWGATLAWLRSP
ncbi:Smr/MutS family protein [Haliangium sp.]|uniref:Smr/MutS family protein n=1 Tax=Haliangium sp. TaxID=2663208 RepID=UPI003D098010